MAEEFEPTVELPIHDMDQRHPGLTSAIAAYLVEAARICLDRHHQSPAQFELGSGSKSADAWLKWSVTSERERNAWANEIDTTEAGASACALATTELVIKQVAVRRAETGTGADYYIGPLGAGAEDLEDCLRLEVSGIDRGDASEIRRRLAQKIRQAKMGHSSLPAMAVVVAFRQKTIVLAKVDTE